MTVYIGIDPGKNGAIAALKDGQPFGDLRRLDTGDATAVADALALMQLVSVSESSAAQRLLVGIELVHSMPGAGSAGMFRFGAAWGVPQGVCAAFGIPYRHVSPQRWTKVALDGQSGLKDRVARKRAILKAARERWPTADLHLVADGAIADALWIAHWLEIQP